MTPDSLTPLPIEQAPLPADLQAGFRELSIRAWHLVMSIDKMALLDTRPRDSYWHHEHEVCWQQVRDDAAGLQTVLDILRSPQ